MTTQTTTPKDSLMIHISLSQCLPATMTLANTRKSTAPNFAPMTDRDRKLEGRAHLAASQGIHVPLIGQSHFPEAAANIDMAESAWTYAEALS